MNLRLFGFASAFATVTVFSSLTGCSGDSLPTGSGGSSAGRAAAGSSGTPATAGAGGSGAGVGGTVSPGGGGNNSAGAGVAGGSSGGPSSGDGGATAGSSTGGSTAGSGTAGGGSEIPATFAMVAALIKDRSTSHSCFGQSCHDSEMPLFHLLGPDHELLTDDALYAYMSTYVTRECGPLINKANPQESALVKIFKGPCGPSTALMPKDKCYIDGGEFFGECISPEYIAAIQQWIAAGAQR